MKADGDSPRFRPVALYCTAAGDTKVFSPPADSPDRSEGLDAMIGMVLSGTPIDFLAGDDWCKGPTPIRASPGGVLHVCRLTAILADEIEGSLAALLDVFPETNQTETER